MYSKKGSAAVLSSGLLAGLLGLGATQPAGEATWFPLGPSPIISTIEGDGATGGPVSLASGRAYAVAGDPSDADIIYLGSGGGGVWKTTDGGKHWMALTDDQPSLAIKSLALAPTHPEILYAGTGEINPGTARGLLKTTDGGATWAHLGGNVFYRHSIQRIVIHPKDPNILYVAIGEFPPITVGLQDDQRGIWKSQDGGRTWRNTTPLHQRAHNFSDVAIDALRPDTLYAAIGEIDGSPDNGIYKTTDGGATWSVALAQPEDEPGFISIGVSPAASDVVYASVASLPTLFLPLIIKKTLDGGRTWMSLGGFSVTGGAFTNNLAVDPTTPDVVYATSFKDGRDILGAVLSTDGGRTWAGFGVGVNAPQGDHRGLAFDARRNLLDANDAGCSRFDRVDRRWTMLNADLSITQLWDIDVHPRNPAVAFGAGPDSGFLKSLPDLGLAWYKMEKGDGSSILIDRRSPSTIYIQGLGVSLQRSDDRGQSWTPKFDGIDRDRGFVPVVIDPVNTRRLVLATAFVYETLDRAETWTRLGGFGAKIDRLAITPKRPQTIYAAAGGRVHTSFDHGQAWTATDLPGLTDADRLGGLSVDARDDQKAYAVCNTLARGPSPSHGHVFRTTDGGAHWSDISGNLPDRAVYTIAVDGRGKRDVLYVGTTNGVFASYDEGVSWARFGQGLPNAVVEKLMLNSDVNILAAGTNGRGMFAIRLAP